MDLRSFAEVNTRLLTIEQTLDQIIDYLNQQQQTLAFGHDLVVGRVNEMPEMVWLPFFRDNVAAGLTNDPLSDGRTTRGYCAAEDGSIVALAIRSNEARTAGTLTLEPRVNATATGFTLTLDGTNTTTNKTLQDQGLDTFARADAIDLVITTTGAWAPTTADIICAIGVVPSRTVR